MYILVPGILVGTSRPLCRYCRNPMYNYKFIYFRLAWRSGNLTVGVFLGGSPLSRLKWKGLLKGGDHLEGACREGQTPRCRRPNSRQADRARLRGPRMICEERIEPSHEPAFRVFRAGNDPEGNGDHHLLLDECKPMSSRKASSTRRQSVGRAGKFAVPHPTPCRQRRTNHRNSFTLSAHLIVRILLQIGAAVARRIRGE